MSISRSTYVDERYRRPVTFTVLHTDLASVYIAPADRPDVACEIGGADFTRCTRDDLRELAQSILTALDEA